MRTSGILFLKFYCLRSFVVKPLYILEAFAVSCQQTDYHSAIPLLLFETFASVIQCGGWRIILMEDGWWLFFLPSPDGSSSFRIRMVRSSSPSSDYNTLQRVRWQKIDNRSLILVFTLHNTLYAYALVLAVPCLSVWLSVCLPSKPNENTFQFNSGRQIMIFPLFDCSTTQSKLHRVHNNE